MKSRCHLAILGSVMLLQPAVSHSNLTMDELLALPLEDLMQIRITSATLTDEDLRTVPSSVTVFVHQQIQQLGVDYLHQLINYVPGFQAFRQEESASEYYHSSRGHRASTSSREVLILLDGQRLNREFDNANAIPLLSLANVEKIEFIRGPGSALYGSNAFLGVINITTLTDTNRIRVSAGSNENTQAQVLVSEKLAKMKFDMAMNVYNDEGESLQLEEASPDHLLHQVNDPRHGYDINLNMSWNQARLSLMHFDNHSSGFYVLGGVPDSSNSSDNRWSSVRFQNTMHWQNQLTTTYSLRAYQDYFNINSLGYSLGEVQLSQLGQGSEVLIANNWRIDQQQGLQFGLEYRHNQFEAATLNSSYAGVDMVYPESERDVYGLYVQHQWQMADTTELTLGMRGDQYSQVGSALSPRMGLTHQLNNSQTLKLLYGQAFRAPTPNELYIRNVFGLADFEGNPDLDPEIIKTWELVWMGNWSGSSLAFTVFHNSIEDLIVRDSSGSPDTFINNVEANDYPGYEAEYFFELTDNLHVRGSYSLFEDPNSSDFRQAERLASLIINYRYQSSWNFNLAAHYAGARDMLNTAAPGGIMTLDDYWLLYAKLMYTPNIAHVVYVQVGNLTDENYVTPKERDEFTQATPNRGREIAVGWMWEF